MLQQDSIQVWLSQHIRVKTEMHLKHPVTAVESIRCDIDRLIWSNNSFKVYAPFKRSNTYPSYVYWKSDLS